MSDVDTRCLDAFPEWLKTLPADVRALASRLDDDALPDAAKRQLAGAVNYLFRSLDLIPDGIEELGYVDDAFVVRVAADLAARSTALPDDDAISALASGGVLVGEFLGSDYARLEGYVEALRSAPARGRTPEEIVADPTVRAALAADLDGWSGSYEAPTFSRDPKTLVKLRSFLHAKLP
jgi:uncharacterized membrane protein YkvA (DUF1232 family)